MTAALLLVAVTPFTQLTGQLRRMHVPEIFVTLFEMIYRYIGVLLEEASSMYTAYMLRSTEYKGLQMRHMGSFVGQMLIRSFDRADRVFAAMKCRGYPFRTPEPARAAPRGRHSLSRIDDRTVHPAPRLRPSGPLRTPVLVRLETL